MPLRREVQILLAVCPHCRGAARPCAVSVERAAHGNATATRRAARGARELPHKSDARIHAPVVGAAAIPGCASPPAVCPVLAGHECAGPRRLGAHPTRGQEVGSAITASGGLLVASMRGVRGVVSLRLSRSCPSPVGFGRDSSESAAARAPHRGLSTSSAVTSTPSAGFSFTSTAQCLGTARPCA
ncbi:hypothetical protein ERJ75_001392000 [Trypanosoma vivax]|nr:hypothetical protein ERJ75_001392000 [Trypanosoma vivax]